MTRLMKGIGSLLVVFGFCLLITAVIVLVILPVFLTIFLDTNPWILTAYIPLLLIAAYDIGKDT